MKTLAIHVLVSNREEIVYIHSLEELQGWIDVFSTDHCEGELQLYMMFDGDKKLHAVNMWCEGPYDEK